MRFSDLVVGFPITTCMVPKTELGVYNQDRAEGWEGDRRWSSWHGPTIYINHMYLALIKRKKMLNGQFEMGPRFPI